MAHDRDERDPLGKVLAGLSGGPQASLLGVGAGVDRALAAVVLEGRNAAPGLAPALLRDQPSAPERVVERVFLRDRCEERLDFVAEVLVLALHDLESRPPEEGVVLGAREVACLDLAVGRRQLELAQHALVLRFDVRPRAHGDLLLEVWVLEHLPLLPFFAKLHNFRAPVFLPLTRFLLHLRTVLHMRASGVHKPHSSSSLLDPRLYLFLRVKLLLFLAIRGLVSPWSCGCRKRVGVVLRGLS
mmetsp:Transcript_5375/g.12992  ORF Transcript_5375/g.12992 Transcript_5375/m.12992 type:complete len:243 (-) Transcript_5375:680-1408(-)